MRTFLLVKLAFLPALLFGLISAFSHPLIALDIGAIAALSMTVWNIRRGLRRPMEETLAVVFSALALVGHLGIADIATGHAVAVTLLAQGIVGLTLAARGIAWTEPYAGQQYAEARRTRAFGVINRGLSILWSVLFFIMAALGLAEIGHGASWILVALGAALSILGPRQAVLWYLNRALKARETYHWPTPELGAASGADAVDVAVIGAGIGGLTAAALLADAGLKVVVVERHTVPGGFCSHWFRRAGKNGRNWTFRFDAGVHDISGVRPGGVVTGLAGRLGLTLDWLAMPHGRLDNGAITPVPTGDAAIAALCARFPASRAGIFAFHATAQAIFDAMYEGAAARSGVPRAPDTAEGLIAFARRHPQAARWLDQPYADLIAAHVEDPAARVALFRLSGYLSDRADDLTVRRMVPLLSYQTHGGFYPKGGSGRLAEELVAAIERRGGVVRLGEAVAGIDVAAGQIAGIRLADGERIAARAVISNADWTRTIRDLLPADALPATERAKLTAAEPSTSAVSLHLGLDIQPDVAPILSGLVDADGREVGLVSPSLVDPSAAPGGGTLELITLVPHAEALAWFGGDGAADPQVIRATPAYAAAKAALTEKLIAAVEPVVPDLRRHIMQCSLATPVTFSRYAGSEAGAIYGVAAPDRTRGLRGPVRGLYCAGAASVGAGIEAVMIAGAEVAEMLVPGVLARS